MSDSNIPSNPWFGISMALVGVIVGYGIAMGTSNDAVRPSPSAGQQQAQAAQQPAQEPEPQDVVAPDASEDHIRGNSKATISLIEYTDFECPFCARHHPTMLQALDEYGDKVNWVFRHYPLPFHPNAMPAALAAECVAEDAGNDAFWEFTDLVFEKGVDKASLASYAQEAGASASKFTECFESGKFSEFIGQQMSAGSNSGVKGTPGTFVYNNKTKEFGYISGAQPYANLKAAIDSLL